GTTVGFTGQRYDSELGLYYFKHRYYSPKLGRFLQPDPIGYTGSDFNLYTYVGNSPQKYTDPMGLQMCWIPGKGDPVDSYIPWYDNPNGLSGTDWFAQFGLSWGEGIKQLLADGGNVSDWVIPPAEAKDGKEGRKAAEPLKDPNKGAKFTETKNWFNETIRRYDNGTVVTFKPNGEITISHRDGTLTTIIPNQNKSKPGEAKTIRPDGTEVRNRYGVDPNNPIRFPSTNVGAPKQEYQGRPLSSDHVG
ncbi:MAG: RHS repeat-associated core domain-containing protein, partial [Candidatus Competibacteraceae bacterium]|nr:RHS repeat-associated core domain-containing protein [Candidatus Competibacteraceae bacterium]